jgi:hypothetical protein
MFLGFDLARLGFSEQARAWVKSSYKGVKRGYAKVSMCHISPMLTFSKMPPPYYKNASIAPLKR